MNDFLKKAKSVAEKAMGVAEEKIGKAKKLFDDKTEVAKLEWELAKARSMFDNLLLEYGKLLYFAEASAEEKSDCYNNLVEVEATIAGLEEDIKVAKEKKSENSAVYCTNCGAKYNGDEKYCKSCGNKLN